MAVILNPHRAFHIAAFVAGIRYRVGFDRKWGFLLTHKMKDKRSEGRMHEVDYNLKLLEAIGIREEKIPPSITIDDEAALYVRDLFKRSGITGDKKKIVIHPGSSNPAKLWPVDNFRDLAKKLATLGNVKIIVAGDESEKELCERIAVTADRSVLNLAGALNIKQLAALYREADLLITNDNGPMHMAAAAGTRVIAIFGRNIPGVSPIRWGPYGEGHIVFHKDPGCSPCYDRKCPYDFKCLRATTPDAVFEATQKELRGRVPKGQA
jgi:ADP-heptose:LPS heptosyltransferase